MGGLFAPSEVETKSENNPYKGLPDWAKQYYRRDVDRSENFMDSAENVVRDRLDNPDAVVGMQPDEIAAIEDMLRQNDFSQGLYDTAATVASADNQVARGYQDDATNALGGERYMSGYTDDVVDTTLAGMDRNTMRQQATRGASEAAIGGLGGTRGGVADALAQQLAGMDRAEMEASLRDSAFRFGSEMGLSEAGMYNDLANSRSGMGLAESGRYESLGTSGMNAQSEASRWQGTGGELSRNLQQQEVNMPRDELTWYANIFNGSRGLPPTGGGTTTGTEPGPSMGSQILGAASTAAGIWTGLSDERAKTEIEQERDALGKLRDVDTYSYRYTDDLGASGHTRERTSGLMAQDLEQSGITGAVLEGDDGLKRVDFYPVLATVVQAVRELDERTRSERSA